ncbi:MAG: DNA polymerase III subunit chi [Rhodobacteraceae bacterium]|nr:DNA polymerase III subunit chi [Paracoccaceae bacterium]
MGAAFFYHLTRNPVEATLPLLLEKSLANGWRVAVRVTDADRRNWLDRALWQAGEGFLPHGIAGGDHDAAQPILLTGDAPTNNPACLMAIDGAPVTPAEVSGFERTCILFDGHDPAAVQHARDQWKDLTEAGASA